MITPAWMAAGRWWMAAGLSALTLNPVGGRFRWRALRTFPMSRLEKMAPNTAVPNEPPIMRKKVTPEVAVPSSS